MGGEKREDLVAVRKGGVTRRGKIVIGAVFCACIYKLGASPPICVGAFCYTLWWAFCVVDNAAEYRFLNKKEAAAVVEETVGEYKKADGDAAEADTETYFQAKEKPKKKAKAKKT